MIGPFCVILMRRKDLFTCVGKQAANSVGVTCKYSFITETLGIGAGTALIGSTASVTSVYCDGNPPNSAIYI